jgi:hypothetical protein
LHGLEPVGADLAHERLPADAGQAFAGFTERDPALHTKNLPVLDKGAER